MSKWQTFLQNLFPFAKGIRENVSGKWCRKIAILTAGTIVFSVFDYLPERFGGSERNTLAAYRQFSPNSEEKLKAESSCFPAGSEENKEFTEKEASTNGLTVLYPRLKTMPIQKNDSEEETEENQKNQEEQTTEEASESKEDSEEETKENQKNQEEQTTEEASKSKENNKEETEENQKNQEEQTTEETSESKEPFECKEQQKTMDSSEAVSLSGEDYQVLLNIVQAEAGGCDTTGKILVANVILNRVKSEKFPDTIRDVVYQKSQFSPVINGAINRVSVSESTKDCVARALNGEDYSQGALYFMNRRASQSGNVSWFDRKLTYLFQHESHEFFK